MSAQNLIAAQAEIFTSLMVAYVGNYGKKKPGWKLLWDERWQILHNTLQGSNSSGLEKREQYVWSAEDQN